MFQHTCCLQKPLFLTKNNNNNDIKSHIKINNDFSILQSRGSQTFWDPLNVRKCPKDPLNIFTLTKHLHSCIVQYSLVENVFKGSKTKSLQPYLKITTYIPIFIAQKKSMFNFLLLVDIEIYCNAFVTIWSIEITSRGLDELIFTQIPPKHFHFFG